MNINQYKPVKFKDYTCTVKMSAYRNNNNTSIQLYDNEDGMPVATATVNPPETLDIGEVVIKDYSENEGMYLALITAGIIEAHHRSIQVGYEKCPVCYIRNIPTSPPVKDPINLNDVIIKTF